MGIIRKTIAASVLTTAGVVAYLHQTTQVKRPLGPLDPVWSSRPYKKFNVHRNPAVEDVCTKRIGLEEIRPELLKNESDLVVELARGVFSGIGYEVQHRYLERKYRGPETAKDLWTHDDLATSAYDVGTRINDHFEVVEKTKDTITVRCGDSPRKQGPRDSDGIFTFMAKVVRAPADPSTGYVELGLKSVLFTSSRKVEGTSGPMPAWMEELHVWYARLWLAVGSRRLLR